jgi:hypothetical protein
VLTNLQHINLSPPTYIKNIIKINKTFQNKFFRSLTV